MDGGKMKNKEYSKWVKLFIILLGIAGSVLVWFGRLGSATVDEVWKACGLAYAISLGVMDFNISKDNWTEKKAEKNEENEEACEVEK